MHGPQCAGTCLSWPELLEGGVFPTLFLSTNLDSPFMSQAAFKYKQVGLRALSNVRMVAPSI